MVNGGVRLSDVTLGVMLEVPDMMDLGEEDDSDDDGEGESPRVEAGVGALRRLPWTGGP